MENDKISELKELMLNQMLIQIQDPEQCTPAFYQAVIRLINDYRSEQGKIPSEAMEAVTEALNQAAPFKFKKSVI
jgi:hypothetical protein